MTIGKMKYGFNLEQLVVVKWKDIAEHSNVADKDMEHEVKCVINYTPGWIEAFSDGDYIIRTEHDEDGEESDFERIPVGCVLDICC